MDLFTPEELETVHTLWKNVPTDHVWTGWAAVGNTPSEIWIFRTRAHWRRFRLVKRDLLYVLQDERDVDVATGETLLGLLRKVEAIPGLKEAYLV